VLEVTVVVPTLGRGPLLELALRSVVRQRQVDLEALVVDDGSDGAVRRVVDRLGDPRVRVLRHERRQGPGAARNSGVAEARGEWVAFLDDDDLWAPDKLTLQLAAARAAGREWAYTGAVGIDRANRVLHVEPWVAPEEVVAQLPRRNVVPAGASSVLASAAALSTVGPSDSRFRYVEDWDLFLRLAGHGPPAGVPAPLVAVRVHPAQGSLDTRRLHQNLERFERRHGIRVDRPAIYRDAAWGCLRAGRRRHAVAAYLRAVQAGDPGSLARAVVALLPTGLRNRVVRHAADDGLPPDRATVQRWVDELAGSFERSGA
jgi:glycosyltransferase involved in cell wall biosynthesis